VDRTFTNGYRHILSVATNRRVVDAGNSRVAFFHSVARLERRKLVKHFKLFTRYARVVYLNKTQFIFRLVGQKTVRNPIECNEHDRREVAFNERNHIGHTSD